MIPGVTNSDLPFDCLPFQHPVAFALSLAIPADKVLRAKQSCAKSTETSEKMKETGGQGDEADSGRTQV